MIDNKHSAEGFFDDGFEFEAHITYVGWISTR